MTTPIGYSSALMVRLDEFEVTLTTPSTPDLVWPESHKKSVSRETVLWPSFERGEDEERSRDDEILVLAGNLTSEILRSLKLYKKGSIQLGRISIPPRRFTTYEAKRVLVKVVAPSLLELLISWSDDELAQRFTYNGKFSVLWAE